jgi:hypothetical protein
VEVGHDLFYPKNVEDPTVSRKGRRGYEYRYVCPRCGREYLYETLNRRVYVVPEGADFRIRLVRGEEVIQVNSPYILKLWGLSPEKKGVELTGREIRKLKERAKRIRNTLSSDYLDDEIFVWGKFILTPAEARDLLGRDI